MSGSLEFNLQVVSWTRDKLKVDFELETPVRRRMKRDCDETFDDGRTGSGT